MNNNKKMTIYGVGPVLIVITALYAWLTYTFSELFPDISYLRAIPDIVVYFISVLLIFAGIIFFIFAIVALIKGFPAGKLITTGAYAITRNPIYSSYILLIIPGLVILTKSWPMMTTPFFMYFIFSILIQKEEHFLEQQFGQEYLDYKSKVNRLVPFAKL